MIILFLFDLFTGPFVHLVSPIVKLIPAPLPASFTIFLSRLLSLILLCIFIFLLGMVTQLFLVKTLIHWGNQLMYKIPFINTVYKVSKDVFTALFSADGKKAFKRPVMVPFSGKSNQCLGFEAGSIPEEITQKTNASLIAV